MWGWHQVYCENYGQLKSKQIILYYANNAQIITEDQLRVATITVAYCQGIPVTFMTLRQRQTNLHHLHSFKIEFGLVPYLTIIPMVRLVIHSLEY